MSQTFRFHGYAIGAAGHIETPFAEPIEVQAATALPQIGGRASARSANFNYRDILKFDVAYSEVTGSECKECDCDPPTSNSTHLRCVVEGLNIMSIITADRLVANLVSTDIPRPGGQPAVRLMGTRFENLQVAGIPMGVDLATDLLDRFDTHEALAAAFNAGKTEDEKAVRDLIDRPAVKAAVNEGPEHFRRAFRFLDSQGEMPATSHGTTSTSLVRALKPERPGLDTMGHVIQIRGFGTVRLAEIHITRRTRMVSMIQIDFDCPYKGRVMCCEIADGGEGYFT